MPGSRRPRPADPGHVPATRRRAASFLLAVPVPSRHRVRTRGHPAYLEEPTCPCCIPALGEFGGVPPRGVPCTILGRQPGAGEIHAGCRAAPAPTAPETPHERPAHDHRLPRPDARFERRRRRAHQHRQGRGRERRRHGGRVVRLLPLRLGRRPRLRRPVLPVERPAHRDPPRVRHLRAGLRRPPAGRRRLRPLRRPRRPQADAGGLALHDGRGHGRDRPAADLRVDRRRSADPAARLPPRAGLRRGR